MKKYFNYILPTLSLLLVVLVYNQWFSSNAPVEYLPDIELAYPEKLDSLPVQDFYGNLADIQMKDAEITLFISDSYLPENNNTLVIYNELSTIFERLEAKGVRVVVLWRGKKDGVTAIEQDLNLTNPDYKYLLDDKMAVRYQQLGLKLGGIMVFAYSQDGTLIYHYDSATMNPRSFKGEIIQGVLAND